MDGILASCDGSLNLHAPRYPSLCNALAACSCAHVLQMHCTIDSKYHLISCCGTCLLRLRCLLPHRLVAVCFGAGGYDNAEHRRTEPNVPTNVPGCPSTTGA